MVKDKIGMAVNRNENILIEIPIIIVLYGYIVIYLCG